MRVMGTPAARFVRLTLTAVLAAAFWAIPRDAIAALPAICLFKRFGGFECLGCGMTRAVHALIHGDVGTAVASNALVVPLALVVVAASAYDGSRLLGFARTKARRHEGPKN